MTMSSETASGAWGAPPGWTPTITVELPTVSSDAFYDALERFNEHAKELREQNLLPPSPFTLGDGWYDITPQMAEAALLNSGGNREFSLPSIKAYAEDMANDDWQPTGEGIVVVNDKLRNGHHRLMSCYLSGVPFRCYVVVTAPNVPNIFAYYDSGKKRTAGDGLHIAGLNGNSKVIAAAVSGLAFRYDVHKLGVARNPSGFRQKIDARSVLGYVSQHPDLLDATHLMLGNYPQAVEVVQKKPVAAFFAWLVLREGYDRAMLQSFCGPLGTGARLDEDSPLLALRAVLLAPMAADCRPMLDRTRLAYLNKAFMMHVNNERMPRHRGRVQPLVVDTQDTFPRIIGPEPQVQAAE